MTARRLGAPLEEVPRAGEALCGGVPTGCLISIFLAGKKGKQSNPCFFGKHTAWQIYVLAFLLMSLLMIAAVSRFIFKGWLFQRSL